MIVQCRHIVRLIYELGIALAPAISGQSYKQFTLVNYDPRAFIRLATGFPKSRNSEVRFCLQMIGAESY